MCEPRVRRPAALVVLPVLALAALPASSPGAEQPTPAFRVLKALPVAKNPHGIAFSPDGRFVYLVSSVGERLTVLDATTDASVRTFPLPDTPLGIILTPDGVHAAISHFGADRISRIDLRTGAIDKTLTVGPRPSLLVRAGPDRAFVSCEGADRVYEIDLREFRVAGTFESGRRPFPPAVSDDLQWLFVPGYDSGDVTVYDLPKRQKVATVKVGSRPSGGIVLPYDEDYAVVNRGSNSISLIDLVTREVRPGFREGLEQEPFSLVVTPDGRYGFVNNTASASVSVIDLDQYTVVGKIAVGQQPIVMAVHPGGRKLYVSCEGSHELVVVSIPQP